MKARAAVIGLAHAILKRRDAPLGRRAGTCHNTPARARQDRNDFYQKTERLAAWSLSRGRPTLAA
jgi:hypothetical protein